MSYGSRLNLLPDPAFLELKPLLAERLEHMIAGIEPQQFGSLLDPLARETLERGFVEAGAQEGSVWLLDREGQHLVLTYNTGPHARKLVGKFKQPLNAGLICMVFASEQPFLENDVWKNERQSKLLDRKLQVRTCAMIALPFYLLRGCRGVVSCVQVKKLESEGPGPPGFRPADLARVQLATALFTQLLEFRLLSRAVGWTNE